MSPDIGTTDQRGWTVAGFRQGGTSAVQFGGAHSELLGSCVAMCPHVAPFTRPVTDTIRTGSRRDRAACNRAYTLTILRARTPYPSSRVLLAAAATAGVTARVHLVPHGAHVRHTAAAGLARGLCALVTLWGVP